MPAAPLPGSRAMAPYDGVAAEAARQVTEERGAGAVVRARSVPRVQLRARLLLEGIDG